MLNDLFVCGVNHHSVSTDVRGVFSLSSENQDNLYHFASANSAQALAILNTCNRTELYGIGDHRFIISRFCELNGITDELKQSIFVKQGREAVEHLFAVACGLDSKVIGDLEILGQVKDAFHSAKSYGLMNGYMERLANYCMQAAKEVRNNTLISNGTTSLAYSIVKYCKGIEFNQSPKVLLIGAGSFARNIAQNLTDYLPGYHLTITNRTFEKAQSLAIHYKNVEAVPFVTLKQALKDNDIIISAIASPEKHLIGPEDASCLKGKLLMDLSVPVSMHPDIGEYANLLGIDELSTVVNDTIESRKSQIPVAREIIEKNMKIFFEWSEFHQNSESLKQWKQSLYAKVAQCPFLSLLPEQTVNKYVNKSMSLFALHIKNNQEVPADKTLILNEFLKIYHEAQFQSLENTTLRASSGTNEENH